MLPGLRSHMKPLDPYSGWHVAPFLQGLYSHGFCGEEKEVAFIKERNQNKK